MLPESLESFPAALPKRLNEDGYGRNMSLFLVMKRYDTNLASYLQSQPDLNQKHRLLMFVQLLEGIVHLNRNQIAHRDLKTDNILLDVSADPFYPYIAITDFGCCLADKRNGLHLPFPSYETDRGGNAALMAPEVATAKPGAWKKISYEKSDVWTAGTIMIEIFGGRNPFIATKDSPSLDSRTYEEKDLPELEAMSPLTKKLMIGLLKRNPSERLSAEMAATICHLYLWCPTVWLLPQGEKVSDSEIIQWLLTLTTKVLCSSSTDSARLEFSVIRVLLKRIRFNEVRAALDWIHSSN
jgi:serine/threonine protein kinase